MKIFLCRLFLCICYCEMFPEYVKCWARIKATNSFESDVFQIQPDCKTLQVFATSKNLNTPGNLIGTSWTFRLDGILHNTTQKDVYDGVVSPLTCQFLQGINGCLMSFGQTGSGKTFTMMGTDENVENRGVIPRAIEHVFRHATNDKERTYTFMVSYVQIYNEKIYDLLDSCGSFAKENNKVKNSCNEETNEDTETSGFNDLNNNRVDRKKILELKEMCECVMIPNIKVVQVHNEAEALNCLYEGENNRAIAAHRLNMKSSRSHCVFSIYAESSSLVDSDPCYLFSKYHLVDLASSERIKKTQSSGRTFHEASYINKSLVHLERVVLAATGQTIRHIPYRDSKLTFFLKDSIGGCCQTFFINHIFGDDKHVEESVSTLKFAMTLKRALVYPVVQTKMMSRNVVDELKCRIESLEGQLRVHDALVERVGQTYDKPSEDEIKAIRNKVLLYFDGKLENIEITGLMQVKEILEFCKAHQKASLKKLDEEYQKMFLLLDKNNPEVVQKAVEAGLIQALPGFKTQSFPEPKSSSEKEVVIDTTKITKDKETSETSYKSDIFKDEDEEEEEEEEEEKEICKEKKEIIGLRTIPINPSREEAFEIFKLSDGRDLSQELFNHKDLLKASRREYKLIAQDVNAVKQHIDDSISHITNIQGFDCNEGAFFDPVSGEKIITEEEFEEIKRLKCLKKEYKEQYSKLMEIKSEIATHEDCIYQARCQLLHDFDFWFLQQYPL